jgi:hypothetical protein
MQTTCTSWSQRFNSQALADNLTQQLQHLHNTGKNILR